MPIDQFRIKIKLDDWKSILELHAEIKEAEHLDANYILCKLIASNAFHFCLFDSEVNLMKTLKIYINSACELYVYIVYNVVFLVWYGKTIYCKEFTVF